MMSIIVVLILVVIIVTGVGNIRLNKKPKELQSSRDKLMKEEYICILKKRGYKEELIGAVYDEIRDYLGKIKFSMYPDDDLYRIYKIDPEDLSCLIMEFFRSLNKKIPVQSEVDKLNLKYKEKMTVEYILELLTVAS